MKYDKINDMTSRKPYLIRAINDWIVDNEMTSYILVNTGYPGVEVPQEHVSNNRIVLNISAKAARGLHIENSHIIFTTSFSGVGCQIMIPMGAVLAIYAKENREGMEFPLEEHDGAPIPPTSKPEKKKKKPSLKLIK